MKPGSSRLGLGLAVGKSAGAADPAVIYSGGSVNPQANTWHVNGATVSQSGMEVRASIVTGITAIDVGSYGPNNLNGNFTLSSAAALTDLNLASNALVTIGSFPPAATSINCQLNPALASLPTIPAPCSLLDANGCALSRNAIDDILVRLAAGAVSSGTLVLSGGTNAAPSATGLAAKATLVSRSWSVATN